MRFHAVKLLLAFSLILLPFGGFGAEQKDLSATLKPGTMLKASLETDLSSSSVSKGDRFNLKILFATEAGKRVALPRGSKLSGRIASARSARRDEAGYVTLVVDQLVFPDGKTETLRGEVQFPVLKDIAPEPNGDELTLRGGVQESEKMTVHSSTSNLPPPSSAEDVAHSDIKSPDKQKHETTGTLDLTKRKGRDVEIAAGVLVNVKILEPQPAVAPAPETPKPPK
ncbi:MAG: TrbI/VirB10 family protein [Acidobacteriia bacterium]|nr:TrbI/VirB10 family protein [Terriglobia bacterium]